MDGQSEQSGRTGNKDKKGGKPFVAEVARVVIVNRNYVITAAGQYVSPETHLIVYYIEYISKNKNLYTIVT